MRQDRWSMLFVASALIIFVASGWAWWHYVRSNPERTFYAAINNSLRTQGMVRQVTQDGEGQKLEQKVRLNQTAQHVAVGQTAINQTGAVMANINTETIGTPTADYIHYTDIKTSQKSADGKDLDFSKLINVWGKSEETGQTTGELYNESVLGVVPFGNLDAHKRTALMDMIVSKKVYQISDDDVVREIRNGRPVYTYTVTVAPEPYVAMLKDFAKVAGLNQLDQLNPADYKNTPPLAFKLTVDVWSQNFTDVTYDQNPRSEKYGSFGVSKTIDYPKNTIPSSELQSQLQAVQ